MSPSIRNIAVILAGGQSRRLFPEGRPKPLLEINGKSLLEQCIERARGCEVYIVADKKISQEVKRFFKNKNKKPPQFIIEPDGRDTAAAVGFALRKLKKFQDANLAVLSADQWIPDKNGFQIFLKKVFQEIENFPESLFVAGSPAASKAAESHGQFGWMIRSTSTKSLSSSVGKFVEKPKPAELRRLQQKRALINCGMFFGKLGTFVEAYHQYFPLPLKSNSNYSRIPRQPIDRAIVQNFRHVRAFRFPLKWEDLGSWEDWAEELAENTSYHSVDSKHNIVSIQNQNLECYVFGLQNICVIERENKLMIMNRKHSRQLKSYLDRLK